MNENKVSLKALRNTDITLKIYDFDSASSLL